MNEEQLSIEDRSKLLGEDWKNHRDELALCIRNVMYGITEELVDQLLKGIREVRQGNLPIQGISTSGEKTKPKPVHKPKSSSPQPSIQGYLRPNEAAQYLGICRRTLSEWMRRRIIPYHKMARRVCLFRKADLDAAMGRFRTNAVGEDF